MPVGRSLRDAQIKQEQSTQDQLINTALQSTGGGSYDPAGTAAAAVAAHEAALDPHPQYLTSAEGNAAYAPVGHVGAGGAAHAAATTSVAGFMSAADKTKLDGVASGATANSTDSALRDRSTHTGTQSLDTTTDSATRLAMTASERTKLAGIATGATANSTDAALRDRSTHTGTQLASTISDFAEAVDDRVALLFVAGANITLTYNDASNTLTISAAGGSGSPGGSSSHVQYNNAGAFDGAANVRINAEERLELGGYYDQEATGIPASPAAGYMRWFTRNRAGRMLPHIVGPSGVDVALQPAMFGNSIAMWLPGTGTTVAINFGEAWTARNAGTAAAQATPARASTNAITSMKRATFGTGTTATGSSGIQSTNTVAWRGNAAGLGGFFFHARFAVETYAADLQVFIGLSALNAALTGDPSAVANTVGLCKDTADTTWQLVERAAAGGATKTSAGLGTGGTQILDFTMYAAPNGSEVTCRLVNAVNGTVYVDNVVLNTTLPANTAFLYAHAQIKSVTGTTAKLLALNRLYIETDL